jgi:hypothetical protein
VKRIKSMKSVRLEDVADEYVPTFHAMHKAVCDGLEEALAPRGEGYLLLIFNKERGLHCAGSSLDPVAALDLLRNWLTMAEAAIEPRDEAQQ